jgi:lycopene cyclase domain-containing protein
MSTYLWINLLSVIGPLLLSFEQRFSFYKKWAYVFGAIIPVLVFFVIWDSWFTEMGVWGFNPKFLAGVYFIGLPLEELLFFVTIPFASLFTYEVVNFHFPKNYLKSVAQPVLFIIAVILLITGILNLERSYTSITFLLTGSYILLNIFLIRPAYQGQFLFAYILILMPFLAVNGILTGSWI